jgi:hypothetical protein
MCLFAHKYLFVWSVWSVCLSLVRIARHDVIRHPSPSPAPPGGGLDTKYLLTERHSHNSSNLSSNLEPADPSPTPSGSVTPITLKSRVGRPVRVVNVIDVYCAIV